MGISSDSHAKIDKGTQSPLLKIFKDIMTREKDDPEKRNLLMEQKEEKKRRHYSGSRSKVERRSCESSASEHRKRGVPYKTSSVDQRTEFKQNRTQGMPYQSEKKESWWFWNNPEKPKKPTEDTCSCVSCALKRFVSSEYACIGCLLLLFTISIIVAFLVVFKNVPGMGGGGCKDGAKQVKKSTTAATTTATASHPKCLADSERLKRKIEMLNDGRMKGDYAVVDEFQKDDKKGYVDGLSGVAGIDFGPSFRELNSVEDSESKLSGDIDWSSILESDKNGDLQSSEKLREFYKKLVQTDAKIKSLKRISQGQPGRYRDDESQSRDRSKRSLKLYSYPKRFRVIQRSIFNKNHKLHENHFMKKRALNKTRLKRYGNDSDEPTGFVIEKKKLLVQYKPSGRKKITVKKCSHAPKDVHTHENQLKHPFYKNSQRLDELLDRFLNKNLPEIINDPFGLDALFKHDKPNKPCKHPKPLKNVNIISHQDSLINQIAKPRGKAKKVKEDKAEEKNSADLLKMLRPETSTAYEKDFYHHEEQMIGKEKQKIVTASPNDFEVLLSVSTIMNPDMKKTKVTSKEKPTNMDRVPNIRRLMQLEAGDDDENLGYEDFKEVLRDDMENNDEVHKFINRKKRNDEHGVPLPAEKIPKYNPPGVHNPNWKGPMPLYPDELNSMIRHAALNSNKVEDPSTTPELLPEYVQRKERDLSDVEYVEDYMRNKYDRLVEMAQAYSDYGVLDGKKDARNDKNSASDITATEHRVKLSVDENFYKAGLLGKLKKGRVPSMVDSTPRSIRRQRDVVFTAIKQLETTDGNEQTGSISNSIFYTNAFSPEGIRVEIRPTTKSREDNVNVIKAISKHVQIKSRPKTTPTTEKPLLEGNYIHSTLISSYPNIEVIAGKKLSRILAEQTTKSTTTEEDTEKDSEIIFALVKGKRSLLSTDFQSTNDFRSHKDSAGYRDGDRDYTRKPDGKPDETYSVNATEEKPLSSYMERVKEKNIRIYSTPQPNISNSTHNSDSVGSTIDPIKTMLSDEDKSPTVVTINKTEMKMDDFIGNSLLGKILLTVENPDIGVEHIDVMFDVPLVLNFKEELMMMNDNINYPNIYNQFEISTESTTMEVNDVYMDPVLEQDREDDLYDSKIVVQRAKRDSNETEVQTEVPSEVPTEVPTVFPPIASNGSSLDLNITFEENLAINRSETENMTLSDFFSMVSDWFKALEGAKVDKPRNSKSGSDFSDIILTLNNSSESTTTESVYPLYDSDMVENIGHRSRVLLSVEEQNLANVTERTPRRPEIPNSNTTKEKISSVGGNVSSITQTPLPTLIIHINVTTAKMLAEKEPITAKHTPRPKIKAIFKRNAEDSNLVFWNDIYDDEYGIQSDRLEKSIRDKHSVKENDFIRRSGRWVHDKIKKFAENLKINPHLGQEPSVHSEGLENKERVPRSVRKQNMVTYPKYIYDRIYDSVERGDRADRDDHMFQEDYVVDQKSIFNVLSSNMKDVCKKAAKAVQQTRNINVPGDNKKNAKEDPRQGSIASTLMQQLVRLLTDLVDYQVQQKTCTKLPNDLQSFLEWLTFPKDDNQETQTEPTTTKSTVPTQQFQEDDLIEELQDLSDEKAETSEEVMKPERIVGSVDLRAHYLDCLHSVQDLLEQYEEMNDDEKSKMSGVKGYLENQMRYLNKQLSGFDLFSLFEKHGNLRLKRDLQRNKHLNKRRLRRKLNKFVKNFGKKHTRTTANYYDGMQVTDIKRKTVKTEDVSTSEHEFEQKISKRNLKDVYYKAVAEAKKYATVKSVHKKDEITHYDSSTTKIHL